MQVVLEAAENVTDGPCPCYGAGLVFAQLPNSVDATFRGESFPAQAAVVRNLPLTLSQRGAWSRSSRIMSQFDGRVVYSYRRLC